MPAFLSKFKRIIIGIMVAAVAFMMYYTVQAPANRAPKFTNLSQVSIAPENIPTTLMSEMYNAREHNLSSLSLRLIVAGAWGNRAHYDLVKKEMLGLLKIEDKAYENAELKQISERINSRDAWMLGRMIAAALYMSDKTTADNFAKIMAVHLEREDIKNNPTAFSVWANGYLLEYYAKTSSRKYKKFVDAALTNANTVIAAAKQTINYQNFKNDEILSTIIWIDVVNLYAAAVAQDKVNYDAIKTAMQTDTKSDSVVNALEKVPKMDFHMWAYFWTMRAAKARGDEALLDELIQYAKTHEILKRLKNEFNDVTAQLAADPNNSILIMLPEPLRNDYVLGVTNQLLAEYID